MADVAISQLTYGLPSLTASIPFSQNNSTYRVALSGLLVNAGVTLNSNGDNVLNSGLILGGGSFYSGNNASEFYQTNVGVQSFNVVRYFSNYDIPQTAKYIHLILPYTNEVTGIRANNMFFLELKGYSLYNNNGTFINIIFSGYQSYPGNGGLQRVSCWDPAGVWQPAVYYSTNYNRTVCRLYMSNDYYTSFVVNAVQVGNGKWALKPGDIQIVTSTSSTI